MSDSDEDIDMSNLREELANYKAKCRTLELKKRESDLGLNKVKTEINSLRSVDKQWKECAKSIFHNLNDVKRQFDLQLDQVMGGLDGIGKGGERLTQKIPYLDKLRRTVHALQKRIAAQEQSIMELNSKIRIMTTEIKEKDRLIASLSQGLDEEVERLCKPMRDKVADCIVATMKEKAARAQEKREIAELWPIDHIMPTMLMKYRCLNEEERVSRVNMLKDQQASLAVALEVRANVAESKSWEIKYDDYGRPFYQHKKTGEVLWDPPPIINYKPPPNRDEDGNLVDDDYNDMTMWTLMTDNKGQIYYKHNKTEEVTYISPNAYQKIPAGKPRETIVGEAALVVLNYIKEKITKHIEQTKKLKETLENPLTPEQKAKKEKADRNKPQEDTSEEEEIEVFNLASIQYDIETVEMLASSLNEAVNKANKEKDPEELRAEKRSFLIDSEVRTFDADYFVGPNLLETDMTIMDIPRLRGVVEELAMIEEKLELKLDRIRGNMKDFSFVLMEKIVEEEREKAEALRQELRRQEIERIVEMKRLKAERKAARREKRAALKAKQADAIALASAGKRVATDDTTTTAADATGKEEGKKKIGSSKGDEHIPGGDDTLLKRTENVASVIGGVEEVKTGAVDVQDAKLASDKVDDKAFSGEEDGGSGDLDDKVMGGIDDIEAELANLGEDSDGDEEDGVHDDDNVDDAEGAHGEKKDGDSVAGGEDSLAQGEAGRDVADKDGGAHAGSGGHGGGGEITSALDEEQKVDYGSMIFALPQVESMDTPDLPPQTAALSNYLVNFALFCGYSNMHIEEAPHDWSYEYAFEGDFLGAPSVVEQQSIIIAEEEATRQASRRNSVADGDIIYEDDNRDQQEDFIDMTATRSRRNSLTSSAGNRSRANSAGNRGRSNSAARSRSRAGSEEAIGNRSRSNSNNSEGRRLSYVASNDVAKIPISATGSNPGSRRGSISITNGAVDPNPLGPAGLEGALTGEDGKSSSRRPSVTGDLAQASILSRPGSSAGRRGSKVEFDPQNIVALTEGDSAGVGTGVIAGSSGSSSRRGSRVEEMGAGIGGNRPRSALVGIQEIRSRKDKGIDPVYESGYASDDAEVGGDMDGLLTTGIAGMSTDFLPGASTFAAASLSGGSKSGSGFVAAAATAPTHVPHNIEDDEWLSSSFFISCSKDKLDQIRQAQTKSYDPSVGLLHIGPFSNEPIVYESTRDVKVTRDAHKPYSVGVTEFSFEVESNYKLWKYRQLMADVVRTQIQKQALRDAFKARKEAFTPLGEGGCHRLDTNNLDKFPNGHPQTSQPQPRPHAANQSHVSGGTAGAEGRVGGVGGIGGGGMGYVLQPISAGRPALKSHNHVEAYFPSVKLQFVKVVFDMFDKPENITFNQYYINVRVGTWAARSHCMNPSSVALVFEDLKTSMSGLMPVNNVQLNELVVEIIDDNPDTPKEALIGSAQLPICGLLGYKMGSIVEFLDIECKHSGETIGRLDLLITADFVRNTDLITWSKEGHDPKSLERLHINSFNTVIDSMPTRTDEIDHALPPVEQRNLPNEDEFRGFCNLMDTLRGDGIDFMSMVVGDVPMSNVMNASGNKIEPSILKPLPNFKHTDAFMKKHTNLHRWEIERMEREIEGLYGSLDEEALRCAESINKAHFDVRQKTKKFSTGLEDIKKDVLQIQKAVNEMRKPVPLPKEPQFEELPENSLVPKLPATGGLDSRGKKKKQLASAELKTILTKCEAGELDAQPWSFPDGTWPSQAQQVKLTKALTLRNAVLNSVRNEEMERRKKLQNIFEGDMEKWKQAEVRRKKELEKLKKQCRKEYIKYHSYIDRVARNDRENRNLEMDAITIKELLALNDKSKDRFKMMRIKQYLEFSRQKEYIKNMKKRLMKAVNARRFALELPSMAVDQVHFDKLTKQAEEALRVLRIEIFDCKQLLLAEGARLRTLFKEELKLCECELQRIKVSKEIIAQRECYDRITERYKFEVLQLFSSLEKLKLQESEKDDVGLDTVDDLGETYRADKIWLSPEINKCQKIINVCMAKIELTEGLGYSAAQSQKSLLSVMMVKWGCDYMSVRDCWVENSDFERSQQFLQDCIQWVAKERQLLIEDRKVKENEKFELQLNLKATSEQRDLGVTTHELETKKVAQSSCSVVEVMRDYLDKYRTESTEKIDYLENSIISLSRECQKIREDFLAQGLMFDEKTKLLWAFIHTLQTSVQQLASRMEIVLEEQEKMMIASKLVSDKMRFQLRVERKHCAALEFIIHSQRGTVKYLQDVIKKVSRESKLQVLEQKEEKSKLRKEIWEQLFSFTRLCTDVDALFEFFAARVANLAGSRAVVNKQLADNGAAAILAAMCKSPRPLLRKFAARALGGMGWDGFVETRVILWDCVMYWKMYKRSVIDKERREFNEGFQRFDDSGGKSEAILNIEGQVEEFVPTGNMSLRTIIKQRRQWALRAARRIEGPNMTNLKLLNVSDGVIPALIHMSIHDGAVDWEIARNAALAVGIASYEPQNHYDMTHNEMCMRNIIGMCQRSDVEVKTHAAVCIANLCYRDEQAQLILGENGAIQELLEMCKSPVVDVLEAATSALANITCYCDVNCLKAIEFGAVALLIDVLVLPFSENLLDMDQCDEVHSNAAETLANISRFNMEKTTKFFSGKVIDSLVLACASPNKQLRRHIPLVLGNIAQSEECRQEIGIKGGIESLFLVLEDTDTTIQANTLWALSNLMWHPPNQERAGRFMMEIIEFNKSDFEPARCHACMLLANALFYNNDNRIRFLECEGAFELILGFVEKRAEKQMVDASLRSLLSLSYMDAVAMWLGTEGGYIPLFISYLGEPIFSPESKRHSLEVLCNLCLHHQNRRIIYESGGIDAIVGLHADVDPHIRELSVKVIDYLQDITPPDVMARARQDIGLDRMVTLASSADPLVRAVAAESIGEEVWHDPKKQKRAQEIGGIDALIGIVSNPTEPVESVLPALWSLRNLIAANPDGQGQFGYRDGLGVVDNVMKRALSGHFEKQTEKVFEAALACCTVAALENERNSRRLLMVGLDSLLDLADGKLTNPPKEISMASVAATDGDNTVTRGGMNYVIRALKGEGVNSLAKSLLLQLAPYNYVVCRNCQRKQDLHGTSCYNCGYRLLIDSEGNAAAVGLAGGDKKSKNRPPRSGGGGKRPPLPEVTGPNKHLSQSASERMLGTGASGGALGPIVSNNSNSASLKELAGGIGDNKVGIRMSATAPPQLLQKMDAALQRKSQQS